VEGTVISFREREEGARGGAHGKKRSEVFVPREKKLVHGWGKGTLRRNIKTLAWERERDTEER